MDNMFCWSSHSATQLLITSSVSQSFQKWLAMLYASISGYPIWKIIKGLFFHFFFPFSVPLPAQEILIMSLLEILVDVENSMCVAFERIHLRLCCQGCKARFLNVLMTSPCPEMM